MNGTRLLDANLVEANIAQIACKCARSDAQKALVGRILFMIDNMPAVDAQPVSGIKVIATADGKPKLYKE